MAQTLTVHEVARWLGASASLVCARIAAGELASVKVKNLAGGGSRAPEYMPGGMSIGGGFPLVQVGCLNCACVTLFAAGPIGIL